jgi:hypothetical protein
MLLAFQLVRFPMSTLAASCAIPYSATLGTPFQVCRPGEVNVPQSFFAFFLSATCATETVVDEVSAGIFNNCFVVIQGDLFNCMSGFEPHAPSVVLFFLFAAIFAFFRSFHFVNRIGHFFSSSLDAVVNVVAFFSSFFLIVFAVRLGEVPG